MVFLWNPVHRWIKHQPVQDKFSTSTHVEVALTWRLTGYVYLKSMEMTRTRKH